MRRRLPDELAVLPYAATHPPGTRWLYFAPHPDDEVFGAGGTLILARGRGVAVRVVIVTDGEAQGDPTTRRREAAQAAAAMGLETPGFLGLADRSLDARDPALRAALAGEIWRWNPDLVLVPAPVDLHPDHRNVAMAVAGALRRATLFGLRPRGPRWLAAYEVAVAILPNVLVAIDDVWDAKQRAVACYESQLARRAYDHVSEGLAVFRSLTLDGVERAEGLFVGEVAGIVRRPLSRWASSMGAVPGLG